MNIQFPNRTTSLAVPLAMVLALTAAAPAQAWFGKSSKSEARTSVQSDSTIVAFDQAFGEDRLVDAGRILDTALISAPNDPRLLLRAGELHMARGRYEEATQSFALAEKTPALKAQALQGRGIALAELGRSDEAAATLRQAVAADPTLWRAWNALGAECDRHRDWIGAEAAYGKALEAPGATAIVYNNRGYSRMLQGRYSDASGDLVKALDKDPTLATARANLRLSLALQGDYARASVVSEKGAKAGVLNNTGFAAMMRGDLDGAEKLFQQAIDERGSTYGRAYQNLATVKAMRMGELEGTARP